VKIELRSMQYAAFASEETACYSASLYVDGTKIGIVGNDGHGGCDSFHGDQAAYREADAWCRANLPKIDFGERPPPIRGSARSVRVMRFVDVGASRH
jgi:hypothetical protein